MRFCYQTVQIGTSQRAVILYGWEGNRGPVGSNGSLVCCWVYDWSPVDCLQETRISSVTWKLNCEYGTTFYLYWSKYDFL